MQIPLFAPLFHFAAIAIGLLLGASLWLAPRGNHRANRWLALHVLLLATLSVGDLLEDSRLVLDYPHLGHVTDWLIFLLGPTLWMYVRRLTLHATPTRLRWCLHALPALACLGLLAPFYLLPAEQKRVVLSMELAETLELNLPLAIAAVQMLAYWLASLWVLARFSKELRENFSSLERRKFTWLKTMLAVTLAMWLLWALGISLQSRLAFWMDTLAVPAGLYLLAFLGLRQPALFSGRAAFERSPTEAAPPASLPAVTPTSHGAPVPDTVPVRDTTLAADATRAAPAPALAPRYARSGLDAESAAALLERVQGLMQLEKPWLENDLTLGELAARAGTTPHYLSQLLNQEVGCSFFDFINARRVEEVQRCLRDPAYRGQTLMALALAAGFNSKAGFNTAFKQHAGMTPSAYRRQFGAPAGADSTGPG